jgi:hypothetical protein
MELRTGLFPEQRQPRVNLGRFERFRGSYVSLRKIRGKLDVRSQNERVELAMQILDRRRKLRQAVWDDATLEQIRTEINRLERQLREIDE